jgi:hypothetical protein
LRNGELLRRAEREFDVFVTMDQRLVALSRHETPLAIVTLRARSNRIEDLQPLVPRLLEALERLSPGDATFIGPELTPQPPPADNPLHTEELASSRPYASRLPR